MQPTSPVLTEEFKSREVVYAKDQPEYMPLPVIRRQDGVLLSRWTPTQEEREALAAGADIVLYSYTFNQPLQPIAMHVLVCGQDEAHIAVMMGLTDGTATTQ